MKNTIAMIMEGVTGIKDLLLHIVGLGVLVQLIFVGGFLGMDIVGNISGLVNTFLTGGVTGLLTLIVLLSLVDNK